jgi:hypothetical protein
VATNEAVIVWDVHHLGFDQDGFGYVIAHHVKRDVDRGKNHSLGKEGVHFVVL